MVKANNKKVVLACSKCLQRNYSFKSGNKTFEGEFKLRKYCPKCNEYTIHQRTK